MKHLFLLATVLSLSINAFSQPVSSTVNKRMESTISSRPASTTQQLPNQAGTSTVSIPNKGVNTTQGYSGQTTSRGKTAIQQDAGSTVPRSTTTLPANTNTQQRPTQTDTSTGYISRNGVNVPQGYSGSSPRSTATRSTVSRYGTSTTNRPMNNEMSRSVMRGRR